MKRFLEPLLVLGLVLFAGILYFTGIGWGLPSRDSDSLLFGDRAPWTGEEIMALAGPWDQSANRGADIAMHQLLGRDQPIELNDTDAKRAEIVRRYRLYSAQPDEMITFRSLSGMKPGKLRLDPKLYQYGGLWIYPVGALLKIGAMLQLVTLRTDLAFYLNHPDQFATFYLVARGYSAVWGLIGVVVVYLLGKQWSGKLIVATTGAALFAAMPITIDLAHEAKPHLAGTVLILLTIYFAMRYVRDGARQWWVLAGVCAGAAMGMVLTGYISGLVLLTMVSVRRSPFMARVKVCVGSGLLALATFGVTNPYLLINLLFHRELLHSNVGNYGTFYKPGFSLAGLSITLRGILDGMALPAIVAGTIAVATLWCFDPRLQRGASPAPSAARVLGYLMLAPAVCELMQMLLLGQGKTAEYARFGLLLNATLALSAAALIGHLPLRPRQKWLTAAFVVAGTLFYGVRYDINFVLDSQPHSTRQTAAKTLATCNLQYDRLAVWAEPAPYCLPPVDLFRWHILLLPRGTEVATIPPGMVAVRPVDYPGESKPSAQRFGPIEQMPLAESPISWANKPFEVLAPARRASILSEAKPSRRISPARE